MLPAHTSLGAALFGAGLTLLILVVWMNKDYYAYKFQKIFKSAWTKYILAYWQNPKDGDD